MRDMPFGSNSNGWAWLGLGIPLVMAGLLVGDGLRGFNPPPLTQMQVDQAWQLQPGDRLGNYSISSGLGDIVIELGGASLYAPMAGELHRTGPDCGLFLSPELPAYRLRLCGLQRLHWGQRSPGEALGRGQRVALALLRRQPQGSWVMVEPATQLLELFLLEVTP